MAAARYGCRAVIATFPVKGSSSAEPAAPVHRCPGSPCRAASVFPFCFADRRIGRADTVALESAIAARLAESRCNRVVRQLGVPACVAHADRGVAVYLSGPRRLDLELGRHHGDLTSTAPPSRALISWRGTSERCTRTRTLPDYAAAGRPRRHPRGAGAAGPTPGAVCAAPLELTASGLALAVEVARPAAVGEWGMSLRAEYNWLDAAATSTSLGGPTAGYQ